MAVSIRAADRPAQLRQNLLAKASSSDPASGKIEDGRRPLVRRAKKRRSLVTLESDTGLERLVKSTARVRGLGEVFTPAATVQLMLDQLPATMWGVHPSSTFLEPACGDGNFLVAILDRKLGAVASAHAEKALPAGRSRQALQFHALAALASIYGVDISSDNILGGTPGHEVGARTRMLAVLSSWLLEQTGTDLPLDGDIRKTAEWIVARNVIVGNMLATDSSGKPTGRESIRVHEFAWNPTNLTVNVALTSMGAVLESAQERRSGPETLFGPPPPRQLYAGPALQLYTATSRP